MDLASVWCCYRGIATSPDQIKKMKGSIMIRKLFCLVVGLPLLATALISSTAQRTTAQRPATTRSSSRSARDEALWQRALAIQRRAIVIDTHNDVTTPMTNDAYDLGA